MNATLAVVAVLVPYALVAAASIAVIAVHVRERATRIRRAMDHILGPTNAPSMSPSGSPAKATAAARPGALAASLREGAGSLPH